MARIPKYENLDTPFKRNLAHLMEERGFNAKSLSKAAGLGDTAVRDILKGHANSTTEKTIGKLAGVLGVSPPANLLLEDLGNKRISLDSVMVVGSVRAGQWADALHYDDLDQDSIPYTQKSEYPNAFALLVEGDSMNLFYPDGTYIIVAPLTDTTPHSGDHVVVQRQKRGGEIEATIKELIISDSVAELWPRSTDPKYQTSIDIHWPYDGPQRNKTHLVEIIGVVISSYQVRRRHAR